MFWIFLVIWASVVDSRYASPPKVTVEEGGKVVLPCNVTAVTGCYITPPPAGFCMTAFTDGYDHTGEAARWNATHCSCILPSADAEAPVDVSFMEGNSSKPLAPSGRVQYVALWTVSVARRPYLSTDSYAQLVLSTHSSVIGSTISVSLTDVGKTLISGVPVVSGAATTMRFSLAEVAPEVQLQPLTITLKREGGAPLERRLFLSRVAPPPPTLRSFVQVDYSRKVLLVNGSPLLGVGYYDSQSIGPSNFTRQARAGINWGMRYFWNGVDDGPVPLVKDYFDWSHDAGMYVMFDLHFFERLAAEGNSTELWANISAQVKKVQDHPALLGYYICDDCTTQYLERQEKAKTPTLDVLYRALKQLDPYHPLIGADEAANVYTFTTANTRIPAPSLDVVMVENYVGSLAENAHTGDSASPGMDGSFKGWPLTWEPVVNCPGVWLIEQHKELSNAERALISYSMSWMSAVLADLPMQLNFRLFPFNGQPNPTGVYEDILVQVGRYARVAHQMQEFLLAPPSGVPEPRLQSSHVGTCLQCGSLWRRYSKDSKFCAAVVIVNTENVTAQASFHLDGAEAWPDAASAALSRVDGVGEARFQDGRLEISIAPFDTHVYITSCEADPELMFA